MKLKDLGDFIVFDTFPLLFEPKQRIIITHLLHLDEQKFPPKLPMIFTTAKLADQMKKFCEMKKLKCVNNGNLVIVKPYEFIDIVLERRLTLQILFCGSEEDESNNLMVLIRQNGKLNYIYNGNFTDIRSALLNDTFASWVALGVDKLYLNLKRMEEDHNFKDIDQMQKVFQTLESVMKSQRDSKIYLHLPLVGYEQFILKLAQYFPKRLKYSNLKQFFMHIAEDDPQINLNFLDDNDTEERIVLKGEPATPCQAKEIYKKSQDITIQICHDSSQCKNLDIYNINGYYELFYSPEPSPFQLKLLCMLVKPRRIFGIVDTFNNKSKVPKYLYELCVGVKEKLEKIQERKLNGSFKLSNTQQQPLRIIGGTVNNIPAKTSGPFLSDSESDDE